MIQEGQGAKENSSSTSPKSEPVPSSEVKRRQAEKKGEAEKEKKDGGTGMGRKTPTLAGLSTKGQMETHILYTPSAVYLNIYNWLSDNN